VVTIAKYGSHPSRLSDLLDSLSPDERAGARLLDAKENLALEARTLDVFPQTSWGTIDWDDVPLLEQRQVADDVEAARLLVDWVNRLLAPRSEVVIFWGNLVVPSIAMAASTVAAHANEVIATSHDAWLFADRERLLIECFHEGKMTVAPVG
jgi:hypothetical protein